MKITWIAVLFLLLSSFLIESKLGEQLKGVVCFKINSCDHLIVCLKDGNYSIIEDSYDLCDEEDVLVGEFKSYGFKNVYNLTKDKNVKVYIQDWEYSEENAIDEWKVQCK
jgi:hypothetical protein